MKTSTLALAALLSAACGGGARQLSYGAPQAPTASEQAMADAAQAAFAAGLYAGTDQPTAGGPGLPLGLATSLDGSGPPLVTATAAAAAALAASLPAGAPATARLAVSSAAPAPAGATAAATFDPACVTITQDAAAASVVWTGCTVTASDARPSADGVHTDTTTTTVTVEGRIDWSAAGGATSWRIREVVSTSWLVWVDAATSEATAMDGAIVLEGAFTTGPATIVGQASTSVDTTLRAGGYAAAFGQRTSLDVDLGYQADPFCVASGTLTLEQVWTRRPFGVGRADLPDAGWRFEWSGCGAVTVAHGG